ncbi:MAG: D-glycero-beta-D-manno-heptose-7-phosphate kinase [Alphaproteobacteria bacterium]|nr:D-glycero-beta-D-manno-heptose-7-phosphate kinase [Alphaproteobacteria bacterium]
METLSEQLIENMKSACILVVGDIMLDRFVYGRVERISPESPVPVLAVERENTMLGGAGNTLSNLVHLECKSKILSVIGDDAPGAQIRELCQALDIDDTGLISLKDRSSIVKTRFLAGHQQLLRTDNERISAVPAEPVIGKLDEALEGVTAVILSDYGKGLLSKELVSTVISKAQAKNIPVLIDPKGKDYAIYKGADVVTPNKKELSEATNGGAVGTDDEVVATASKLLASSGIKNIVATRSADGMSVISQNAEPLHIRSAANIEVFDVSGAGDTVIATIAAALASGATLQQAALLANLAGSIVVAKVGTAPIRAAELKTAVKNHDIQSSTGPAAAAAARIERVRRAPVLSWSEAEEEIRRWRARGLKTGFTNGCFDILHYGHVSYLNEARSRCDRLIVGLNSDSSVRILKGPERPVHDEASRAGVLAALGSVDMVVLFGAKEQGDDNTACKLLDRLQPDIYFKGGDYAIDQIPEAPGVLRNGGKVEVMPVYEGHSTTASIAKARTRSAA